MDIRFVDCDSDLKKRICGIMGPVAERYINIDVDHVIVAMDGSEPVGVIAVGSMELPEPLLGTFEGYINIIEVLSGYRRQGIGRGLVEAAMEYGRRWGFVQLRAWSSEDKIEAIPMWKALGFGMNPCTIYPQGEEVKGYFVTRRI
jgi:GNAT superfamily N-acetyltransferase